MLYVVETDHKEIDQVGKDLEEAVKKRQFGVLAIHNMKETMAKKGVVFERECRIYEVCNPHQAKSILEVYLSLSTILPCRISVYEEEGKVRLATIKPTALIEQFGKPTLRPIAEDVEKLIYEMMEEAIK